MQGKNSKQDFQWCMCLCVHMAVLQSLAFSMKTKRKISITWLRKYIQCWQLKMALWWQFISSSWEAFENNCLLYTRSRMICWKCGVWFMKGYFTCALSDAIKWKTTHWETCPQVQYSRCLLCIYSWRETKLLRSSSENTRTSPCIHFVSKND